MTGFDMWDGLIFVGLALVAAGAWVLAPAAGYIVAGLECVATGILLGLSARRGST